MTTPTDEEDRDLRYAEYVLGVLDSDARGALEREIARNREASARTAEWSRRLAPLADEIVPETPPPQLWTRILKALEFSTPTAGAVGPWHSIRLWRALALGTGALLAAACAALVFVFVSRPPVPPIPFMAATITETDGQVGWTATMDISKARMIVVPAVPQAVQPNRTPELWLIAPDRRPIPVGLISTHVPITLTLSASLVELLGPSARLAVTIEPRGGSPTGQPTGPVVAAGAIGAAGAAPPTAVAMRLARPTRSLV
jgi:anti-sigma-K factor RskA